MLIGVSASYANASIDDLQIGNNNSATQTGITLGSTDESAIAFADTGDARAGSMTYNHGANTMIFKINGQNERFRVDSTGIKVTNSADNTIVSTITNNGVTGGHCLKLTSGGTGAGTNIFSVFRNNQSSEGLVFNIDGTGHIKIGPTSFGTTSEGMTIRPGNESTLFRDTGIVLLLGGGQSGQKIVDFRHGGTGIGNITKSGTSGIVYNTSSITD